ncbi:hypothetical protein [Gordonia hydrophobica]|uniref:DUF4229 domain-containing protein n=1 Tax=Gordonia hydrophobica TaxID=40516 RepID=A0ABZ2TYX7_9ACTN|nr:hypothetical protein [Gordonia hydrophobica]MBM7367170.1 membrane protein implicated in regulation of membrane protease activity [Gordonia hydrophobica]
MNAKDSGAQHFSFAKLVFYALGAGVLVLVVTLPIVIALARPYPTAALCVAIGGILLMVVVIALVSRRMMSGVQQEIDRRRAEIAARQRADGDAQN